MEAQKYTRLYTVVWQEHGIAGVYLLDASDRAEAERLLLQDLRAHDRSGADWSIEETDVIAETPNYVLVRENCELTVYFPEANSISWAGVSLDEIIEEWVNR